MRNKGVDKDVVYLGRFWFYLKIFIIWLAQWLFLMSILYDAHAPSTAPFSLVLLVCLALVSGALLRNGMKLLLAIFILSSPAGLVLMSSIVLVCIDGPRIVNVDGRYTRAGPWTHLDPYTRLPVQNGSGDFYINALNNSFVTGSVWLLGHPSGAYLGPIPTEEQAWEALVQGQPISGDDFVRGDFIIGSADVKMNDVFAKKLMKSCLESEGDWWGVDKNDLSQSRLNDMMIRADVWGDDILVLGLSGVRALKPSYWNVDFDKMKSMMQMVLVDLNSGRVVAYYNNVCLEIYDHGARYNKYSSCLPSVWEPISDFGSCEGEDESE